MSRLQADASNPPTGPLCKIDIIIDLARDENTNDSWTFHLEGYKWLCRATRKKLTGVAEALLLRGAKVNVECDEYPNNTPLHFAAKCGDVKIVRMLLERHADVHAKNSSGLTALHCAATCPRNVKIIESLLRSGASPNARCNDGRTALHCAADLGSAENVICLVDHGARIDVKTKYGNTPYEFAIGSGNQEIIKYFASFENIVTSTSHSNRVGWNSIHFACLRGNKKLVESLLNDGAVLPEDMATALCIATIWKRAEIVEILLTHGVVDVDAGFGLNGSPALQIAVENDDWKILELILQFRPDIVNQNNGNYLRNALHQPDNEDNRRVVNVLAKYGFTLQPKDAGEFKTLHSAVQRGNAKIVKDLLDHGANVHLARRFEDDFELLHRAARHRNTRIAKLLINHGIDVNTKVNKNGNLSLILHAIYVNDAKVFKFLLSNGANVKDPSDLIHCAVKSYCKKIIKTILNHEDIDVNAVDKYGNTPLHYAVSPSNMFCWSDQGDNMDERAEELIKSEIADLCLTKGANVDTRSSCGLTPLHFAVVNGYEKITKVLLFHNADVNSLTRGAFNRTALMEAAESGNVKITRMLLEKGAETSLKNENEQTALHLACYSKHYKREIVESLILAGADLDALDNNGRTALHVVANESRTELVRLLLSHGANVNAKSYDGRTPLDCARCDIVGMDRNCFRHNFGSPHRMAHVLSCNRCVNINFDGRNCNREHGYMRVPRQCVIDILTRHIVQMKALDRYVSPENLRFIDLDRKDKDFYEMCKKECKMLRDTRIANSNVSFYNFLTKSPLQLAMSRKNVGTMTHPVLLSNCDKIFPIYSAMIQHRTVQGQMRAAVFDASSEALNSLVKFKLPYLTFRELSSYLTNQDMTNLIKAAEPVIVRVKNDVPIPDEW